MTCSATSVRFFYIQLVYDMNFLSLYDVITRLVGVMLVYYLLCCNYMDLLFFMFIIMIAFGLIVGSYGSHALWVLMFSRDSLGE